MVNRSWLEYMYSIGCAILGSIFYFGYLIAQYPAGYALQRLPIGKVMGIVTIGLFYIPLLASNFPISKKKRANSEFSLVWGGVVMTTPACTNFPGIAANRFILGLTEAIVNPGFVLIMSIWYTSAEQPLRLEAYYCTNGIATMFGGLVEPLFAVQS
jgi:MFS family permease